MKWFVFSFLALITFCKTVSLLIRVEPMTGEMFIADVIIYGGMIPSLIWVWNQ